MAMLLSCLLSPCASYYESTWSKPHTFWHSDVLRGWYWPTNTSGRIGFVDDLLHCQGYNSGGMEVFEVVFARIRRLLDVHHIYSVDIKLYRVIKKE